MIVKLIEFSMFLFWSIEWNEGFDFIDNISLKKRTNKKRNLEDK